MSMGGEQRPKTTYQREQFVSRFRSNLQLEPDHVADEGSQIQRQRPPTHSEENYCQRHILYKKLGSNYLVDALLT